MNSLKYTVIKNEKQYNEYCDILEKLIGLRNNSLSDEIELLTLLIERWDTEHNTFYNLDPIELVRFLMKENKLKAKDLANILDLSKGTISKILNYHKGLSKETIRNLSERFKVSQEAFNRPYKLVNQAKRPLHFESLMNS
jgi:HTH-type transcriptional regulator/antitoxin HigA